MMTREDFLKHFNQPDWSIEKAEEARMMKEKIKTFGGLTKPNLNRLIEELNIRMQMAVEFVHYVSEQEIENKQEMIVQFLEFYQHSVKTRISAFAKEATNEEAD